MSGSYFTVHGLPSASPSSWNGSRLCSIVVSIGSAPSGRYVTAMACMVAPLTSGVPVAVTVWITPGASRPDCASLLTFAE